MPRWEARPPERDRGRLVIVTYGCTVMTPDIAPVLSHEHKQLGLFALSEVPDLHMPDGYKQSIAAWLDRM
ncbi:hypothetical protein ACGFNU_34700 [Spirillospora sp. NPDC048911]|uniref:hypothetical protein n=1 Tax=Spirillospora sp. NPDC048911 TaxID=3364527 RepID=UPI003719A8CF